MSRSVQGHCSESRSEAKHLVSFALIGHYLREASQGLSPKAKAGINRFTAIQRYLHVALSTAIN